MPQVNFIDPTGVRHSLEVQPGDTLKQAAVDNLVAGIIGDCGGFASCGTCHAYIDDAHQASLQPPSEDELFMLEGLVAPVRETSRLTCQIVMTEELDGVVVHIPAEQG
jgi:2Fe-2S ferredoxin